MDKNIKLIIKKKLKKYNKKHITHIDCNDLLKQHKLFIVIDFIFLYNLLIFYILKYKIIIIFVFVLYIIKYT